MKKVGYEEAQEREEQYKIVNNENRSGSDDDSEGYKETWEREEQYKIVNNENESGSDDDSEISANIDLHIVETENMDPKNIIQYLGDEETEESKKQRGSDDVENENGSDDDSEKNEEVEKTEGNIDNVENESGGDDDSDNENGSDDESENVSGSDDDAVLISAIAFASNVMVKKSSEKNIGELLKQSEGNKRKCSVCNKHVSDVHCGKCEREYCSLCNKTHLATYSDHARRLKIVQKSSKNIEECEKKIKTFIECKDTKIEKVETAGPGWFNMKVGDMTDERKRDFKIIGDRQYLDPKRFYKKDNRKKLPKFFQVGTVISAPIDYYSGRLTKKQRKQTLFDEVLSDIKTRTYIEKNWKKNRPKRRKTQFRLKKKKR